MSVPTLGYWDLRGNTESIRLLLHYAGVKFTDKRYKYGPAPDYSREEWTNEKEKLDLAFPNLPYWIDGDLKLTQSSAILRHVARKAGLVPQSLEEQAIADMLEQQAVDFRVGLTSICYNPNFENLKGPFLEELPNKIKAWSKYLGKNKYLLGDKLTFVDFIFYDALQVHQLFNPSCLKDATNLAEYLQRIESLENVQKYHKSGDYHELPYNGIQAKWGGKKSN